MTGQGYVIGLALLDAEGVPLIGVMGVPSEEEAPPIMAAVAGHGLRWWNAQGDAALDYTPPTPDWAARPLADGAPPWLVSPQKAADECMPFGAGSPPAVVCCGAMIKYHAVAAGRVAGFIQYEEELKTWDHVSHTHRPSNSLTHSLTHSGGVACVVAGRRACPSCPAHARSAVCTSRGESRLPNESLESYPAPRCRRRCQVRASVQAAGPSCSDSGCVRRALWRARCACCVTACDRATCVRRYVLQCFRPPCCHTDG